MQSSTSTQIVFITRKWHETGGMQKHSRDLAAGLAGLYGDRFVCIHPQNPGMASFMAFALRAIRAARTAHQILLGDCAMLLLPGIIRTGRRTSVIAHGLDVIYPVRLYQRLIRKRLPKMHRVVCVSRATAEEVKKRGVPDDHIVIIPCGIPQDVQRSQVTRDPHLIVTVGRLIPRKGTAWFVREVLPLIRRKIPDARLLIIGAGPEESRIRATARKWKLLHCIDIRTHVRNEERSALVSKASLFVLPNIIIAGDMEGFGIACIEAAACGTQVLAADSQGIPDAIIDGKTGRLYKTEDSPGCAEIAVHMLRHPLHPADVERSARSTYDWQVLLPRFRDDVFS